MMKKALLAFSALGLVALFTGTGWAQTINLTSGVSNQMNVTADIITQCAVDTGNVTGLHFNVTPADLVNAGVVGAPDVVKNTSGTLAFTCTDTQIPYWIALGPGNHGAVQTIRKVSFTDAAAVQHFLNYELFKPQAGNLDVAAFVDPWGDDLGHTYEFNGATSQSVLGSDSGTIIAVGGTLTVPVAAGAPAGGRYSDAVEIDIWH